MMPPVSLPLKGGTISARADWLTVIPETTRLARRPAAAMIRIHVTPIGWPPVYGAGMEEERTEALPTRGCGQLLAMCCRAALDLPRPSRHRPTHRKTLAVRIDHARPLPEIAPLCRSARPQVRGAVPVRGQGRQSAGAEF